jgi:hypothetical protein
MTFILKVAPAAFVFANPGNWQGGKQSSAESGIEVRIWAVDM